ncbi:VOC family protein [Nocardioides nanhaiensis]|uniref:VOC family protein n=1 Tax=Nocardioides nanhaiensis TaxID=1476871 RepID=A0ABP8WFW9_9ACTN
MPGLNPYLQLRGEAREALDFYHGVFGGEASAMTYADAGGMGLPQGEQHLVMHASLDAGPQLRLMLADLTDDAPDAPNGVIMLSGPADDGPTLTRWFEALADGGSVAVPLELAPWGDHYGQVTDRFGVSWMVDFGDA